MRCDKIKTLPELKRILRKIRQHNKSVVFTNGCFDIIHVGHVTYLAKAKSLGDILVVGLNSDSSVTRLKGKGRPLVKDRDRAKVLSALEPVDFVVIFSQSTPIKLIKAIKPDVLVKGGDWKIKDIVGGRFVQSYGGLVKSLPFVKGFSTKSIIKKMEPARAKARGSLGGILSGRKISAA